MKKTIVIFLFLILGNLNIGTASDEKPPSSCLGYFYAPKAEELFQIADSYIPESLSAAKNYRGFLSTALLKNTKIDSFDLNKDILYMRLEPKDGTRPFLYRAHLKDKELFMTGFGKNIFGGPGFKLKEETRNQGIEEYLEEKTEFDRDAYLKALEKGPADPAQFQKKAYYSYYVAFQDDMVIVSGDRETLKKVYKHAPEPPISKEDKLYFFLRPFQAMNAYHDDIENLKNKFNTGIFSNEAVMPEAERIIESDLSQMKEMSIHLRADAGQLNLDLFLKPSDKSKFSAYLLQENRNTSRLKTIPPAGIRAVLEIWLPSLSIQTNFLESPDTKTPALISNYFQNCEGLFRLYMLQNHKIEGFISALIKKGLETQAEEQFINLFRTVYKAQISGQDIQTIQLPKRNFYHQFFEQSQWFGIGFDSAEDFKNNFSALTSKPVSHPGFRKITDEFPDSLMLFFYYEEDAGKIMAAYGQAEKEGFRIHFRVLGPHEWLNKLSPRKTSS